MARRPSMLIVFSRRSNVRSTDQSLTRREKKKQHCRTSRTARLMASTVISFGRGSWLVDLKRHLMDTTMPFDQVIPKKRAQEGFQRKTRMSQTSAITQRARFFAPFPYDFWTGSRSGRYLHFQFIWPKYTELQKTVLLNHAEPGTTTQQSPAAWR